MAMTQLVGIEYNEPNEVRLYINKTGIRVNIDDRCVFVILNAKHFSVRDTRAEEEKTAELNKT